ncbi:MAG: hypothetical protein DCC67_09080 [Planctomycetota bacterium]|nr:MAG: hypothetical protein DCC67_09080 [Planctomycetota bacterium]
MAKAIKYIAILGLFLAAVCLAAGAVAARRFGTEALAASAVAAAMIWLVGGASLLLVGAARNRHARVNAALLGLLVRMSLPLAAVVYFSRWDHPLTQHGIVPLIVVHYLAGLALETALAVRLVAAAEATPHSGNSVAVQ